MDSHHDFRIDLFVDYSSGAAGNSKRKKYSWKRPPPMQFCEFNFYSGVCSFSVLLSGNWTRIFLLHPSQFDSSGSIRELKAPYKQICGPPGSSPMVLSTTRHYDWYGFGTFEGVEIKKSRHFVKGVKMLVRDETGVHTNIYEISTLTLTLCDG